jgi:DNA-binding response OmpR family regulator
MAVKILIIEGKQADHPSFAPGLVKKGYQVETTPNGSAALTRLISLDPDLVVVDAASLRTSGRRICQSLRREMEILPIVLILPKEYDKNEKVDANVVLNLPFTVQKLANRIRPFMPVDEKDLLHVGPIRLNLKQRQVRCLGRQSRLTPHLVTLLKLLMEHPGEVMERSALFRLAWETEYIGDTRTLDVHISWLRRAIEVDPRHPRFLKTVRGVGYRLDV